MKTKRPIVLLIIDGWGLGTDDAHNAIFLAHTPNIDRLTKEYPHTALGAAGEYIGLTLGHQGSSEMGHLIIGAGRNVLLPQTQVTQENFSKNRILLTNLKKSQRVHIIGLCSDKGVHSYLQTGLELQQIALAQGKQVYWHIFADGRDAPPKSIQRYVDNIKNPATLMGRWWAMDRDQNWNRVQKAFDTMTKGKALFQAQNLDQAIAAAYARGESDEFIKPTLINPNGIIQPGDVVLNFNYRVDRAIEITNLFCAEPNINYVSLTEYYPGMPCPSLIKKPDIKNILGEILSTRGYSQLRIAETEKWIYVTQCFNAMREKPFPGEDRILIPSDKVATFDLKPEMQALKIAQTLAQKIAEQKHDVFIVNLANPDMVGHTANQPAIIKACETVDQAVGIIYKAISVAHGKLIILSDHGDAECNIHPETGDPHTSHTDNFVPFILVDPARQTAKLSTTGRLCDVAPTLLYLLNEIPPKEMTGKNIII